jgi:hypothetical protein
VAGVGSLTVVALFLAACAAGPNASAAAHETAEPSRAAATDVDRTARPAGTLRDPGLPTLMPQAVLERVPTRVTVPALGIDLPVIEPPRDPDHYPYCNVAEFLRTMSRPGRAGTTFIYAHARAGMFLPILEASRVNDGEALLGVEIHVFTSDDRRFSYGIAEVRRHVTSLDFAYRATAEALALQTSEGPHGTPGKTIVIATPTGEVAAARDESRPAARPVRCEPAR